MACQNIERIYNEIAEKKYPEIVAGRKRAEMRADKAEEKANKVEEENAELKNNAIKMVKNLLQMGISVEIVSKATNIPKSEILMLMES